MKNLKRALSLVLSTAMVLGMMVVGSGAASYPDVAGHDYEEAIEVVKLVGVMTGDEKGNFNPDAAVTRNEMAVIMVNLMDLKLNGAHPFTDVPAWADDYVGAVYTNGVSAGTSATTYGGSANVTAAQAALMIMRTLGYFEFQGEFGEDWQLATVKRADDLDLFEDIDAGVTESLTRAEVAQMIMNALDENVVIAYEKGGLSIEGNGITVTEKAEYEYDPQDTLQEELFGGKDGLEKHEGESDKYGRPAVEWTYDGDSVTIAEKPLATYAGADFKEKTVEKEFDPEDDWTDLSGMDVYYNGSIHTKMTGYDWNVNGVTVELYGDEDEKEIDTIVVVEYYVAEVTTVITDEDDEVESVEITAYLPGDEIEIDIDAEDDEDAYALVEGYEEEDILMVCLAQDAADADDLLAVADVETVEGEVTATSLDSKNNGWIKVDGTKYEMAWIYAGDTEGYNSPAKEDEGTFYLYNGFVVYADTEGEDAEDVYAIVLEAGSENTWNSTTHKAEILKTDGTTEVIEIALPEGYTTDTLNTLKDNVVAYEYDDEEEVYVLDVLTAETDYDTADTAEIEKGKTAVIDGVTANGKTVYVIIELDDGEFDTATAYTGYKSVASAVLTDVKVIADGKTAEVVFATYDKAIAGESEDVIYVVGASRSDNAIDELDDPYYTYTALVAGEIVEIMVDAKWADENKFEGGLFNDAEVNGDGIYSKLTATKDLDAETTGSNVKFEKAADDVITIAGDEFAYAEDAELYVVDDDSIVKGSINKNYFDVTITYTTNDDGEVELVVVVK